MAEPVYVKRSRWGVKLPVKDDLPFLSGMDVVTAAVPIRVAERLHVRAAEAGQDVGVFAGDVLQRAMEVQP